MRLGAQGPAVPALGFLGFAPGQPLRTADSVARALGGTLRCRAAARDRRVHDCRAALREPGSEEALALWISAIDSGAAVVSVRGTPSPERIARWRAELVARLGPASPARQHEQSMQQWIRGTRMLRLTWRTRAPDPGVAVSLVDGARLDAWTPPPQPSSRTR
ncbi:MAG: hypothetical protein SFU84_06730 [Gemmatimonadales bacterium]|nr:hypothetical protein [Gemmatimonadales bacterium]